MSKFTIVLYQLVKTGFNLGLDKYPIYLESYRPILNQKIIDHYAFEEIGFETPQLFKLRLNTKMNEIMPYYNRLYGLDLSQFINLNNVNMDETHTTTNTGNQSIENSTQSTNTTSDDGKNRSIFSDTPQSLLTMPDIENDVYASNATIEDNQNTTTADSNGSASSQTNAHNTEDFIKSLKGYDGRLYPPEVYDMLASKIMDIDLLIINQLEDLFMKVW